MTRDDFISFLVRAVQAGYLSEPKAIELLRAFDSGKVELKSLPLPLVDTLESIDDKRQVLVLLALLALLGLPRSSAFPRFIGIAAERLRDSLLTEFRLAVRALAAEALRDAAVWQGKMDKAVVDLLIQQRMVGSGRLLTVSELAEIQTAITEQLAFLSRFADKIAVSIITASPLSLAQIGVQSEAYGGAARAQWFRGVEGGDDLSGFVIDYASLDDDGTCFPCLEAEANGPYAVNDRFSPFPGSVCLGGARCRCKRIPRYAPNEAAQLAA